MIHNTDVDLEGFVGLLATAYNYKLDESTLEVYTTLLRGPLSDVDLGQAAEKIINVRREFPNVPIILQMFNQEAGLKAKISAMINKILSYNIENRLKKMDYIGLDPSIYAFAKKIGMNLIAIKDGIQTTSNADIARWENTAFRMLTAEADKNQDVLEALEKEPLPGLIGKKHNVTE